MPFKLLISELATGIILTADARNRHVEGVELPYLYFNFLAEALSFAEDLLKSNDTVENILWHEQGDYLQTITTQTQ